MVGHRRPADLSAGGGTLKEVSWPRVWEVFESALQRSPPERRSYLEDTCGEDDLLRQTVASLLAAEGQSDDLLSRPLFEEAEGRRREAHAASSRLEQGTRIGPYRVLRQIGQGGMGTVYLAVRGDDSFERKVVIKLARSGMESEALLARLRTERQILAGLDHQNIARLYDGGATEDGLPYFVMEYVEGMPIDAYCEQHDLSIDEILTLFREVCVPVRHAHQNLVVHRDIKPSNILIDARGVPKLLDFGIAKLLNAELAAGGYEPTATLQRVLTPNYASPEQIRGKLVTTVSDVYSLGVLLYQLLTGHLPRRIAGRSVDEIETLLTDSEPLPPSVAVTLPCEDEPASRLHPAGSSPQAGHRTSQLSRQLAGDLDAILLKALRSAPQSRYGSVEQLSADIERYQLGLAVEARAGSWRYRAGKFVRRNRKPLAATGAAMLLLLGFAVAMVFQASRVAAERDRALSERDKKSQVLSLVLDLFRFSNPYVVPGQGLTVQEALERSVPVLETRLHDQPEVRAELLRSSGSILRVLGSYHDARDQLEEALEIRRRLYGEGHPDVVETMTELAATYIELGENTRAEALARRALEIAEEVLPAGHPDRIKPLNALVALLCYRNDYGAAEAPAAEALAFAQTLPTDSVDRLDALEQLATIRNVQGDYREAARLRREVLALIRMRFGEKYPSQIVTLNNLGLSLRRLQELDAAESVFEEALSLQRYNFGDLPMAPLLANLAGVHYAKGDYSQAESLHRQALDAVLSTSGPEHWLVYFYGVRIARTMIRQGAAAEAEASLRRLLERWRPELGADHWRIDEGVSILGESVSVQQRCGEAEPLLIDSYERLLETTRDRTKRDALARLGEHLERCGRGQEFARYEAMLESLESPP